MDFDVVVETIRALVTAFIVLYLWRIGKREQLQQQKGWRLIVVGFLLVLFAALLDITDNFPGLNQYVIVGKTHTEAFLEKMVGYLGGFIMLFIGFTQWFPLVAKLRNTEAKLQNKTAELESKVSSRTAELLKKNEELEKDKKQLAEAEEKIRQLAYFDTLTRLPNRRLLNDRVAQAMVSSNRNHHYNAIIFLDLDNFKQINDTHGHTIGDLLLIEVAHRLTACVREADTVARLGGDEFVVMLSELAKDKAESASQACIIAEKIRVALAELYVLTIGQSGNAAITVEHHCTSSAGVVLFNNNEATMEEILERADAAMYQAKVAGRNLVLFNE